VGVDRARLTPEMTNLGPEAVALALKGFDLAHAVRKVDRELQAALT
jgi:hypothetical protein